MSASTLGLKYLLICVLIDLRDLQDAYCSELFESCYGNGLELLLLDFGIP